MGCKPSIQSNIHLDCWQEDWLKSFKKDDSSIFVNFKDIKEDDREHYCMKNIDNQVSKIELLDDYEKELIRYSWSILSYKHKDLGRKVFLRIFELRPSAKIMFPFKNASGEGLVKHPQFNAHAKRFLRVIACVVERLNRLEECHSPLISLGVMHLKIKGFLPDYFDVFTRSIIDIWRLELKDQYMEDMDEAWRKILDFIVMRLKEGYESEKMRAAYFAE